MIWLWIGFLLFVAAMLALDLGVFHRKAHAVSVKEALIWSGVWIALALAFTAVVYPMYSSHWHGVGVYDPALVERNPLLYPENGAEAVWMYLTGYLTEKSLSVDNIFVIVLIFSYFRIPSEYQHRVLFWGIIGAVVLRGIFIFLGVQLIETFHWIIYVFGAFLVYTAWKLMTADEEADPGKNPLLKFVYRHFPVTQTLHGQKFVIDRAELAAGEDVKPPHEPTEEELEHPAEVPANQQFTSEPPADAAPTAEQVAVEPTSTADTAQKVGRVLTPLGLALIIVEATDLIFAVDSIPAIMGITLDPFLVFTSNIFAILGLRALYFALAGIIQKFHYLKIALAVVLGFIGIKMLMGWAIHGVPWLEHNLPFITLAFILVCLTAGVVVSLLKPLPEKAPELPDPTDLHATKQG